MRAEGKIHKFEDLEVWQKSHNLVLEIYIITKDFPKEEKFGLISQMRRAVVSVPTNIVEGFRKRSEKDKTNFYNIAQASLDELRYYIILARDLHYLDNSKTDEICEKIEEVARMLNGLINSVGSKYFPNSSLLTTHY